MGGWSSSGGGFAGYANTAEIDVTNGGIRAAGVIKVRFFNSNSDAFYLSDNGSAIYMRMGGAVPLQWASGSYYYNSVDTGLVRNAAGVLEVNNGTAGTLRDIKVRSTVQSPPASVSPAVNGELVVEATSNTTLTFKLKGSDGTVRSATLTLA